MRADDVSARTLGGSLFTSTVAVWSSRADLPAPQPSARGSGYWDATPAVWGCSVATTRGVQEPYGRGAPWRERSKKHGKVRQKLRYKGVISCADYRQVRHLRSLHFNIKSDGSDETSELDIIPHTSASLTCASMLGWIWRDWPDWFCWTTGTLLSILTG